MSMSGVSRIVAAAECQCGFTCRERDSASDECAYPANVSASKLDW